MLKPWLNLNGAILEEKTHEQVIESIATPQRLKINLMFYELKDIKSSLDFIEDVTPWLIGLFLPQGVSIRQIFFYKIYMEYLNKTYKFLRILYNLPLRKTRTHGISKKKKWLHTQSITYCLKTTRLFKKLKLPKSKIQVLFFCEFINSMWFFNWWKEWSSAHRSRIKFLSKNPFVKWKYDVIGLQQGRAVFFSTKKKKTKHNRKKSVVLKSTYNIGFGYGFTTTYLKLILAGLKAK